MQRRIEELEAALARSERRQAEFLKALDHLPSGVEIYDATGLAAYLNPAMVTMTSLPSAEVALGRFNILTDPFSKETGLLPLYEKAYRGELVETEEFAIEMERAAADWGTGPKQVWFRMILVPQVANDGSVASVFAIMFETTEERRIAKLLELASRREGIELLAGGVAHDYNNLLSAIITNSELLVELSDDEDTKGMAEDVLSAATQAVHLTGELLSYANPNASHVRTADLRQLSQSIAGVFRGMLSQFGAFEVVTSEQPCLAEVNEGQFKQVIMNLLTNAMQAIGDKGSQVTLAVHQVFLDAQELKRFRAGRPLSPGVWNRIQVVDDGVGMRAEVKARIFEPYFTTKKTGHGIGLAATLSIVEQHAGAVAVDSEAGKGTTFEVLLPLSIRTKLDPKTDSKRLGLPEKTRVAVVDPTPFVRGSVRALLERSGCAVSEFASGQEAIDRIVGASPPYDLVVMELMLSSRNGLDVLRELRESQEKLPVLLMGTHVDMGELGVASDPSAVFVSKPFSTQSLLEAASVLLSAPTEY